MYMGRSVTDDMYTNDIYFIVMVVLGSFFLLNLVVAVLYMKFHEGVNE